MDIEGDRRPEPRFRTRMKMLWDDQALYIAAELEEPHVWATLTEHDSVIFHDNDFEVFLDPDGDSHLYAELELNALNTTWDLLLPKPYKDGGKAVDAWEIAGLEDGRPRRRHAQRPARQGPRLDGRDRLAVEGARGDQRRAPCRRATATSGASTSRASSGGTRSSAGSTARSRTRRNTTGSGRRRA